MSRWEDSPYGAVKDIRALEEQIRSLERKLQISQLELKKANEVSERRRFMLKSEQSCNLDMLANIEKLEEENKRLLARDGKATITLSYPTKDYPFNTEDLEVVDFGVADNGYMVTSKLFNAMQEENKRLREALEIKTSQHVDECDCYLCEALKEKDDDKHF
jgi:hypothetical protein